MATPTLLRSSSSLSRSPSIRVSIDKLSCLDEVPTCKNAGKTEQAQEQVKRSETSRRKRRKMKTRMLLPPVAGIALPCVYLYARSSYGLTRFHPDITQALVGFWFDYVFIAVFVSAILVSLNVAFPELNLVDRLRCCLSDKWECLMVACLKPFGALVTDSKSNSKSSGVTWTIGSEPKYERLKGIKEGVQNYGNGDMYEGEFHQGRFSGSGVYHFSMSGTYEGCWVDGKYDGYGVETWARGSRYRGQYRQGLREGYGIYRFYTGDIYSGEWSKGQSHGCGIQTCEDGSQYVGEFKWGLKHGFGCYQFCNGDSYSGEYFADKMHGYGVYQFANGHRYEGAWHEGKRKGLGVYVFRNGEMQGGYWHAGSLLPHNSRHHGSGGVCVDVNHSKILQAVQEARRASLKAHQIPKVDDRVNKAVTAANRAANAARVAAVRAVQSRTWGQAWSSEKV